MHIHSQHTVPSLSFPLPLTSFSPALDLRQSGQGHPAVGRAADVDVTAHLSSLSQIGVTNLHQPKRVSHHRARVTVGRRRRFRLSPKLSRADLTLSVLYCQPEKRKSGKIHD